MRKIILIALIAWSDCFAGGFGSGIGGMGYASQGAQEAAEAEARRRNIELQNQQLELQIRQQRQRQAEAARRRAEQENARQVTDQFWVSVGYQVPDYQMILRDANFVSWLDSPDPLTDITRRTYLDDAVGNFKSDRTASILNEWKFRANYVPPASSRIVATNNVVFFSELARIQPKWERINNDDAFRRWLLTSDNKTGIRYQTYLEDAQKSLNVTRVERIFVAWFSSLSELPPYMLEQQPRKRDVPKMNQSKLQM